MEKSLNKINYLKNFFDIETGKGFYLYAFIILALEALIVVVSLALDIGIYTLPLCIGAPIIFFVAKHPKMWVYTVIVSGLVFLRDAGVGVSATDVIVVGGIYLGGFLYWLFNAVFVKKIKLVSNYGDWLICVFFIGLLFNVVFAVMNGVVLTDWIREYLLFLLTLLYFPLRVHFSKKEDVLRLLAVIMVSYFILDLIQLFAYYRASTQGLQYAYQLTKTTPIDQAIFSSSVACGFVLYFYFKSFKTKLMVLLFTALSVGATISTFSRTYWVILFLYIGILFIYLPVRKKIQFASVTILTTLMLMLGVTLFFSKYYDLVMWAVTSRFVSAGDGKADLSVQARFSEYASAIKYANRVPLSGNGLAKELTYYDILENETNSHKTIHNAFIYMYFKVGVPLAIFYFAFILYYIFTGILLVIKLKDEFYKAIALCGTFSLGIIFIASFASAQIVYRDGIIVTGYGCYFISLAQSYYRNLKSKKEPLLLTE